MKDQKISLNKHCPCIQFDCAILGNCVLCVQNHIDHKRHIPECFQNILRPELENLAKLLESKIEDCRPKPGLRTESHKKKLLSDSIKKHQSKKNKK